MYNVWYRIMTPNKYCTEKERLEWRRERKLAKRDLRFHINLHLISKQTYQWIIFFFTIYIWSICKFLYFLDQILNSTFGWPIIRYFQWLFGQTNNMVDDDIRSLFIDALHETLRYDEKKQATGGLMPASIFACWFY